MSEESSRPFRGATPYGPTLFSSMVRYRYAIAAATVIMVIVGYALSSMRPPVYEATANVVLSDEAFGQSSDPVRKVQQEAIRLSSRDVLNRAAELLGDAASASNVDTVDVAADSVVGLLSVSAAADDPQQAAAVANSVVAAYQEVSATAVAQQTREVTDVLQRQQEEIAEQIAQVQGNAGSSEAASAQRLEILRAQSTAIQTRIIELTTEAAISGSGLSEVEDAVPPAVPSSPNPTRDAAATGLAAFVVASGLAYWRSASIDRRKLDPAAILESPLLAEIPEFQRLGSTAAEPLFDIEATEAYQFLLSSIEYRLDQTGARSILVTSASAGDGKSLTSLHLARALAVQGRNVMLVDADIRARGLSTLLRAEEHKGLVTLAEGADLKDVIRRYRISPSAQLALIPSGAPPHQPTGLLATEKYREAISTVIASSDLTIIDAGPLLTVADASAVATQVAGILLIVDARTTEDDLLRLKERLRLISTPVLGCVINRASDIKPAPYPYGASRSWRNLGVFSRILRRQRASAPLSSGATVGRAE